MRVDPVREGCMLRRDYDSLSEIINWYYTYYLGDNTILDVFAWYGPAWQERAETEKVNLKIDRIFSLMSKHGVLRRNIEYIPQNPRKYVEE